jgi:hypothetical protein
VSLQAGLDRYASDSPREAWSYVCGMCNARETTFLADRLIDDIGMLAADEAAARVSRTFFGAVEKPEAIDRAAARRTAAELAEIAGACPSSLPVDLVRLRPAADRMRAGLEVVPQSTGASGMHGILAELSLRAGDLADHYAGAFDRAWDAPGDEARSAVALAIDSAELLLAARMAELSGDEAIRSWVRVHAGDGSARAAERGLAMGIPRELFASYFFLDELLTPKARDFLYEFTPEAARGLRPDGVTAENAASRALEAAALSRGEPFSPGVVLRYLVRFTDQVKMLRLAMYRATGRIPREAA